jgi:hypothetical protein
MSKKTSSIDTITFDSVPARLHDASKAVKSWRSQAMRMTKERPGRSLFGAFAVGFVLAKMARFV